MKFTRGPRCHNQAPKKEPLVTTQSRIKIVRTIGAAAKVHRNLAYNQRLASRLTELLQTADDERECLPGEIVRPEQCQRKESKENECGQDKRSPPVLIRQWATGM
jgi:hypothetical protein